MLSPPGDVVAATHVAADVASSRHLDPSLSLPASDSFAPKIVVKEYASARETKRRPT
jgi:hypothetical protein